MWIYGIRKLMLFLFQKKRKSENENPVIAFVHQQVERDSATGSVRVPVAAAQSAAVVAVDPVTPVRAADPATRPKIVPIRPVAVRALPADRAGSSGTPAPTLSIVVATAVDEGVDVTSVRAPDSEPAVSMVPREPEEDVTDPEGTSYSRRGSPVAAVEPAVPAPGPPSRDPAAKQIGNKWYSPLTGLFSMSPKKKEDVPAATTESDSPVRRAEAGVWNPLDPVPSQSATPRSPKKIDEKKKSAESEPQNPSWSPKSQTVRALTCPPTPSVVPVPVLNPATSAEIHGAFAAFSMPDDAPK